MKKKFVAGITGIVVAASAVGFAQIFAQEDGEVKEETSINPKVVDVENSEQAKDVSEIEGERYENDKGEKMIKAKGAPPINVEEYKESNKNVNEKLSEFIAEQSEKITEQSNDPRLKQTSYDEGFNIYLKSQEFSEAKNVANFNLQNASETIKKDFENIFKMDAVIGHSQFVRTAHLDGQGQAKEDVEHSDQWKPTNDDMRQAHEYMKQIIHDLDVALNHNGEGETYGVTHTLNGDKVSEVESSF